MKKVDAINAIWSSFGPVTPGPHNRSFHQKWIYVSDALQHITASPVTLIEARRLLGVRAGWIAGRHVWWAPTRPLPQAVGKRLTDAEAERIKARRVEKFMPVFTAFLRDSGFSTPVETLMEDIKFYWRKGFSYSAVSGCKQKLQLTKHTYKHIKYWVWDQGVIEEESLGSLIEGCFDIVGVRVLSEKRIMEMVADQLNPATVSFVLEKEYTHTKEGWRTRS